MGRRRASQLALATALAAAVVAPGAAQGTVTIGSNLARGPDILLGCGPGCTVMQANLVGGSQAANGIVSPVNGTVVLWRIRAATPVSSVAFRVVKPLGGNLFTGAGTSAIVIPPADATTAFPAQLPIAIGDKVGLNCCATDGNYFVVSPGSTRNHFQPPLADGAAGRSPSSVFDNREVAVNADIEPTSTFSILTAKPRKGGKVEVTVNLPNPGTLAAGDKGTKLATAAGSGNKTRYLKPKSTLVAAPGQVVLVVKPTKAAKQALSPGGRLKARMKLAFTPTGGIASTRLRNVKLKP